jgi:hypothetical protein
MRKLISMIAVVALCATVAPAANAAKGTPYKGKTSGGHTVRFTLKKGKLWNFATGVPITCLAIQGGGAPLTGVEPMSARWLRLPLKDHKATSSGKPAFHYNDVTMNWTLNTRRTGKNKVSGAIRLQYQFLIPKYPIGTFTIYSCLGNMRFTAKPAG